MLGIIQFTLNKVPTHWWRKGIKNILIPTFSFYVLNIATSTPIIEKYRLLFFESKIWYFILIQILVILVFYIFVDFLLRLLAFKVIKKRILKKQAEMTGADKVEMLRVFSEYKNSIAGLLMGYPVELGYISKSDLKEIDNSEPIVVSTEEKEKAINEVITALNKWACLLIHLACSLLLVWHYDKILMTTIIILGFILTVLIYTAVIILISNVEMINTIIRHLKKLGE